MIPELPPPPKNRDEERGHVWAGDEDLRIIPPGADLPRGKTSHLFNLPSFQGWDGYKQEKKWACPMPNWRRIAI